MRGIRFSRIVAALRAAWRCEQGAAATEFAFLAPLLMLMLLGTIEVGRAISMDRHLTMATSTASDLVAREESLGETTSEAQTNLNAMMDSIQYMMKPYDASTLKMGVFQVRASPDDASDTRVDWSYSHNGYAVPSKCDTYTLPSGLIDKGASVIVVKSSYVFHPLFADFVPGFSGNMTWNDTSIHSPRNSCVDYVDGDNCVSLDCP
jgi:Flp pilus assembly protein TadG